MLLCTVVIQNRVVVFNRFFFFLLKLYLLKHLPNNMTLYHCVISAVSLCKEAERVFSEYLDIEADGAPVGSH